MLGNYISRLIPVKLLENRENVIYGFVLQNLNSNNILTDRQVGYLPKSFTSDALTIARLEWYDHLEGCKTTAMALFDLSKAFDCLPYRPLVHELRVAGPLLSWFMFYLFCRTQLVALRGTDSKPVSALSCVPQGSVLWPLMYVNDLCLESFSLNDSLVLYAGDTTLFKPIAAPSDLVKC